MSNLNDIMVSVCMITYNHEKYISQAIEGVLMQETSFPIELVIGEDCSTDHTRQICLEYQEKYPDVIKLLLSDRNKGVTKNLRDTLKECKGKYIAYCEGDDYWTDSHKLQLQVDYMEKHIECGLCYTDYDMYEESSDSLSCSMFEKIHTYRPTTYEQHLLKPGYLAPMTWLFRKKLLSFVNNTKIYTDGTYSYMLEFMFNSKIDYLPFVTATYRNHYGSASSPIGSSNLFNYLNGTFNTRRFFSERYPCSKELKNKILLRGYLSILPVAIEANNEDFVNEARKYMESKNIDIDLIIRELKAGENRKKSKAYRLGKFILRPFSWLKK